MPLIFSSLDRIENISTAMELRAFGKNKKELGIMKENFLRVIT